MLRLSALVLAAICGAALVHLVEYHAGIGSTHSLQSAADMLAQCPLSGALVLIALCALSTAVAVSQVVRRLSRRRRQLRAMLAAGPRRALAASTLHYAVRPRRPGHLFAIVCVLLAAQSSVYALSETLWPMGRLMRMHGVLMHMPSHDPVPVIPLQLLVALVFTVVLWRLERRVTVLRAAVGLLHALLQCLRVAGRHARPLPEDERCGSRLPAGLLGLPRPPPNRGLITLPT